MADDEVTGGDAKRRSTYTPPPEGVEFPERLGELTDEDIARAKRASEAASLAQESDAPEPSPESATYLPSTPFEAPVTPEPVAASFEQPVGTPEPTVDTGTADVSVEEPAQSGQSVPENSLEPPVPEPVIPPAPTRTSLDDQQIMAQFYDGDSPSTETLMNALEAQLDLRAQEDQRFDQWASQIRTLLPSDEAETLIGQSRRRFDGLPPLAESAPEPAPHPAPEPNPEPDAEPEAVVPAMSEAEGSEEVSVSPESGEAPGDPLLAGLVADTADIPLSHAPSPLDSTPDEPDSTRVFDRVLSDPDAVSPPTAAWPLVVIEEQESDIVNPVPVSGGVDAESPEWATDRETDPEEADSPVQDVEVPPLAESGISVGTETLTIKQAVATKEIPAEPFNAVTVEKESWFSFDRSGVEPSPELNRTARVLHLFWTWWSVTVPLGGVLLGAWLTLGGSSVVQAVLAATIGVLIGAIPLVVGTLQGVKTGLPSLIISRQTFGLWGNVVPAVIAVVIRIAVGAFFLWAGVWVATQVYVEANLWTSGPELLSVIIGTVAVLIVGALVIVGRHWVSLVMWISGGLSLVAAVLLVVVTWELPTTSALQGAAIDGPGLVSGASLVAALMLVLWSQSGSDIARFRKPGRAGASSFAVGVAAVIPPIVVIAWGALLGASGGGVGKTLIQSPIGTVLDLVPDWYPVPALILLAAPLLGLSALALHSSSYAVMSLGFAIPRVGSAALVSVVAAGAVFAVTLTVDDVGALLPGLVVFLGVPAAAWVGAVVGDFVTRRAHPPAAVLLANQGAYPGVRVAPLLGFVGAIGVGWGFVGAESPALVWTGYFNDVLMTLGMVDLSDWQLGVAVSLVMSFAVASLAGIRGGVLDGSARKED